MATEQEPQDPWPALSIGVITTDQRQIAFGKLLQYLIPAVEHYVGTCELVVGNNTGTSAHAAVEDAVQASGIRAVCSCTVVDSPKNNIATGRNTVFDNTQYQFVAFIDDDEFPIQEWLTELVTVLRDCECQLVAGPIVPVFEESTSHWVKSVDIHNARGLHNHDIVPFAASGNFLIDKHCMSEIRLDENYGKTGGSDTEFFLRLGDIGVTTYWAAKAIVHEDIPANRSTVRYTIRRCLSQGTNYRRIMSARGAIGSTWVFLARAFLVFAFSLPIGLFLILIRHPDAGHWMKRAFSNLGKLYTPDKLLYG